MIDEIYSYREMCELENVQTLQRGMNYRMGKDYSVVLMSRRPNAIYKDVILDDGVSIEYEGHDEPKSSEDIDPKTVDQPLSTRNGTPTQNGKFVKAVETYRNGDSSPEKVKVYEKLLDGVWSLKGIFDLLDFKSRESNGRKVWVFTLRLAEDQIINSSSQNDFEHTRLISSEVKKQVWKRDNGECVICGSKKNLHFDHELPFSKGGTSLNAHNIRILCASCNLAKSDKIE